MTAVEERLHDRRLAAGEQLQQREALGDSLATLSAAVSEAQARHKQVLAQVAAGETPLLSFVSV